MADSIILAAACEHGATVWTLDEDFRGLHDVRSLGTK
jgi:predicted nucleic acid-binding protein